MILTLDRSDIIKAVTAYYAATKEDLYIKFDFEKAELRGGTNSPVYGVVIVVEEKSDATSK